MNNDVIYSEEVLAMFDGKLTYRVLLNMIREKKIPAMKAGRRYIFSRQVVERWRDKRLGRSKVRRQAANSLPSNFRR